MIRIGKTYGNWMVDLRATNVKLKDRSIRIVSGITGLGVEKIEAQERLKAAAGRLIKAIQG